MDDFGDLVNGYFENICIDEWPHSYSYVACYVLVFLVSATATATAPQTLIKSVQYSLSRVGPCVTTVQSES